MKLNLQMKLLFLMVITLSACEECDQKKNLIVFFDLSTSLDSLNISIQAEKIRQLVNAEIFNTDVTIYPMDGRLFPEPLFDFYIPKKRASYAENDTISFKREKKSDSLKFKLIETYMTKNGNKETEFQSCIITSFEAAYNLLKDINKDCLEYTHVIFMSDMIEQCPESSAGSIYMCSKQKEPDFIEMLEKVKVNYNPDFNLYSLTGDDRIHIVITSSHGNQKKCLTEKQQGQVWKKVLKKIGYDNPETVYFSSKLPDMADLFKKASSSQ